MRMLIFEIIKLFISSLEFRDSLGLLGYVSETVFTDMLFNAFNRNGDTRVTFQEYIHGLRILTRGSQEEKLVCFAIVIIHLIYRRSLSEWWIFRERVISHTLSLSLLWSVHNV